MPKDEMICVRLETEMYERLQKIAKDEDRSLANVVRRILKEYLNSNVPTDEEKSFRA